MTTPLHGLPDPTGDTLLGTRSIDYHEPAGLRLGQRKISTADGFIEGMILSLHAVHGPAASGSPTKPLGDVQIKQERQIREKCADGEPIHGRDIPHIKGPGHPLVDGRRIQITIAQNYRPPIKGGLNDLSRELGAARGEKQKFRLGSHGGGGSVILKKVADGFPDGSSPGFPERHDLTTLRTEKPSKPADLGRLACSLPSFESDENSAGCHENDSITGTCRH
jgi:hypothetical protein